MTKVLIVEDQKMAQENMEAIINDSQNYTLAGIISNAADAELFCMRCSVNLILMDVCTARDESGIEACAVIKKKFPNIKIIIVTSMAEHTFIEKAKEVGAQIICCSALLTTTMSEMKEVVELLNKEGLHDQIKVMIGGAPLTQEYCDAIGADFYTVDAASCSDVALKICTGEL